YMQHSAFYPVIEHLHRMLDFRADDTPKQKLEKLQRALSHFTFPQADTLPLIATLLSLPPPHDVPPLTLSPQRQKEKTHEALVAWMCAGGVEHPTYYICEDLHWADPSTLEMLSLLLAQVPRSRLLIVLTFRPDFAPPWRPHSYITQIALGRLGRAHV